MHYLPSSFSVQTADYDTNGLYDGLLLEVTVISRYSQERQFLLSAQLSSTAGIPIASVAKTVKLQPNSSTILNLFFFGPDIAASGIDGPYRIGLVTLVDEATGALLDSVQNACLTLPYSADSFIADLFQISPDIDGEPVDSDGNGLYNSFDIAIPIAVLSPGLMRADGVLCITGGVVLSSVRSQKFLV